MSAGHITLFFALSMLVLGLVVGFWIGYECGKYQR